MDGAIGVVLLPYTGKKGIADPPGLRRRLDVARGRKLLVQGTPETYLCAQGRSWRGP